MMYDMISEFSKEYSKGRISDDIMKRTFDKPLWMYCIDIFKGLEHIPGLTLDSYELIEDQSKINIELDRKIIKEKKILNTDTIQKIIPIDDTDNDLLKATFSYQSKGRVLFTETVEMFIPHQDKWGYYRINGRTQMPLNQIVDNSTFVKDNVLTFKTIRNPIKISTEKRRLDTSNGPLNGFTFHIDLFIKKFQPLLYYLAALGLTDTIKYFYLEDAIGISAKEWDKENYLYYELPCVDGPMFLTMDKKFIKNQFAVDFFITLAECLIEDKSLGELKEDRKKKSPQPLRYDRIYDITYWKERLAYQIDNRDAKRARPILISFKRCLDDTTKNTTAGIKKVHMRDTFSLVRYLMTEYYNLIKKDNHDMANKRVRSNECLASYLDQYITSNIYSLLGDVKIRASRIRQLLRSINHGTMHKALSQYELWRYERYNDFDAINLVRYTFAGPAGINGGKYKTAMADRVIYPSQIGILDISTSTSSPGVTGFFCINVKLHKLGAFANRTDPSTYIKHITAIEPTMRDFYKKTERTLMAMKSKDTDGRYVMVLKKTHDERLHDFLSSNKPGVIQTGMGRIAIMYKERYDKDERIKIEACYESNDPLLEQAKPEDRDRDTRSRWKYDENGRIVIELKRTPKEIDELYMRRRAKTKRRRKDDDDNLPDDED